MHRYWTALVFAVVGCGPGSSSVDEGGGATSSSTGTDDEPSGTQAGETTVETTAVDDSGGTGSATTGEADSGSGTDSGGEEGPCVLALRLDTCCTQAFPATPAEVDSMECVVRWPIDPGLPAELLAECAAQQPEWCQIVDCSYVDPPTEDLGLSEKGDCYFACPDDTSLGYTEPGCGEPPPIVQCLPPPLPCVEDYCSCEGVTIIGCGAVGEPFEHVGPCAGG